MKLKDGFLLHESDGEQILVSVGNTDFSGLVRFNSTAAFIIECLKNDTTEEEIVSKMYDSYDAAEDVISANVKKVLDTLRSIGALDE